MNTQIFQYNGNSITFKSGDTTMVNATQMAKSFGKRPTIWLSSQQSQEYLNELAKVRNLTLTDLVIVTRGGSNPGTWMHEDVALEFARWLSPQFAIWCNDRIKELIRYGITATPQTIDSILADPGNAIKVLTALQEERKRSALLEDQKNAYHSENKRLLNIHREQSKQLEIQAPKVEYADNVLNSTDTYTITQIAKEIGMSAQRLNKILHDKGVQFKQAGQWFLYSKYDDKGFMKSKTYVYNKKDGRIGTMLVSVWTEAGRHFIHSLLKE